MIVLSVNSVTSTLEQRAPANQRTRVFCALTTALLCWLPIQKWGLFPLAWIGLAPLLWAARDLDAKSRRRYGWRAGFGFYALTNWWIVPTVIYGSPMIGVGPAIGFLLGIIAVAFISSVHGCQVALALWLWDEKKWARHLWFLPIIVALVWAAFDWLRCVGPLSHIWGALAFSQWRDVWLLQIAPFVGQHGLTALVAWCGASLALWYSSRRAVIGLVPAIVLLVVHGFGAWILNSSNQANAANGNRLDTLLVSTNIPSLRKSNPSGGETPIQQAWRLTEEGTKRTEWVSSRRQVIVWPETTVEVWDAGGQLVQQGGTSEAWLKLREFLRQPTKHAPNGVAKTQVLTGATYHRAGDTGDDLYNAALILGQEDEPQKEPQMAPKVRTVPMGEKAPFGEWIPLLKRFAPEPEVTPGVTPKVLNLNGTPIGTVICFESCFPYPARGLKQQGAKVLFILTNDEWFTGTNSPWEHATMAILRAAENQIPVAQVANGGYTLLVDSHGRIEHQSFGAGATLVSIPLN